jgi:adenylosuccinate synthase
MEGLDKIKICTAYKYKGKTYTEFPASRTVQKFAKPIYEEMPGFNGQLNEVKSFNSIPINAQKYIKRLESLVGVPISLISLGRKRDETIEIKKGIKLL